MPVSRAFAEEIATTTFEDIPPASVETIKRATLDNLAITFFSYDIVDRPFAALARSLGGNPQATIVGDGARVSAGLAAGVNSQMASDSDFEEQGPGVHMFAPISAMALAVGEMVGASGREVITATALGYELNTRVFDAATATERVFSVYRGHPRRHLYFNVAVVAARMLGLDVETTERAIGLAWVTAMPPRMEMTFGLGNENAYRVSPHLHACQIGLQSVLLASEAGGGLPGIVEATIGDEYRADVMLETADRFRSVHDRLSMKPRVGSWGFQGGLQLLAEIIEDEGLGPAEVESVVFRGPDIYVPFANPSPRTFWEAQGSIPLAFASLLLGIPSGKAWVDPERLRDPERAAIAARVTVAAHENPEMNEVEVKARGRTMVRSIHRSRFHGSPNDPLTRDECAEKFLQQALPVVGRVKAGELIDLVWNLEEVEDVAELAGRFS
jgi:2-methylcitrate dehydratase